VDYFHIKVSLYEELSTFCRIVRYCPLIITEITKRACVSCKGLKLIEEGQASGEPPHYWATLHYGKNSLRFANRDSFEIGSPTGRTTPLTRETG